MAISNSNWLVYQRVDRIMSKNRDAMVTNLSIERSWDITGRTCDSRKISLYMFIQSLVGGLEREFYSQYMGCHPPH